MEISLRGIPEICVNNGKLSKVLGAIEVLCNIFSRNVTPHPLVMLHNAGPYTFLIMGPLHCATLEWPLATLKLNATVLIPTDAYIQIYIYPLHNNFLIAVTLAWIGCIDVSCARQEPGDWHVACGLC